MNEPLSAEPVDFEEFFKRYGKYVVPARFYECRSEFTVEEMFQAFKARMEQEV